MGRKAILEFGHPKVTDFRDWSATANPFFTRQRTDTLFGTVSWDSIITPKKSLSFAAVNDDVGASKMRG